jgi:hypothetical protein
MREEQWKCNMEYEMNKLEMGQAYADRRDALVKANRIANEAKNMLDIAAKQFDAAREAKKRMDIRKAEWDDFYNEELMCSFCGRLEKDCAEGGDHSFEMREIVRESTRYW